ncbi:hypothetical protein BRC73_06565 [Halobacteriales archaeon QH_7_66_37]|nr:MAG: hypothetical protein BRC73_06565 [Halobacteriales archaeon QH_7_66_37]
MAEMEESVSGFKQRGSWVETVEHGERIAVALEELAADERIDVDEEALAEFEEWRPKSHERLDEDVSEKTADQASVEEGKGEQEGKDPDEDLQTAGEKLAESYENLDDPDEAVDKWGESIDYVARAADSAGRKAIRKVEDTVYRNVMTQMSPYYFDNDLISANIQRVGSKEAPEYVFEVNVNDDDLKIRVSNRLSDYDEEVERWHVNTEKETDTVEAAEGVEPPDDNGGPDAKTN